MRAGRVNGVTTRGEQPKPPGMGGKGAAVSPVTWGGASGTGRTESQSGLSRRPRGSAPRRSYEWKAQQAQSRRFPGGRQERVPRDASREGERGQRCGDEDERVQYEADERLATSTVRGGVDGEEEPRCTKKTTHVGRANSGKGGPGWRGKRRQGSGLRRDTMCAERCPTILSRSPACRRQ